MKLGDMVVFAPFILECYVTNCTIPIKLLKSSPLHDPSTNFHVFVNVVLCFEGVAHVALFLL